MSNEDGTIWIVFNGEIYNFPDLRLELISKGHVFRTRSDTETVIHAYEEWGVESLSKLNGIFGLAIWDQPRRELILARDPFGIKPIYYADQQGNLTFGSEIKAILANPEITREVDLDALDQYLAFTFVPSPRTMFTGINKLPPGYFLRISSSGTQLNRFYFSDVGLKDRSDAEWLEALQDQIESAVQRQMISDVPVGVMLSGGMDSAAIAMLMRKSSGQSIHSFTVGFEGGFELNELTEARRSAELIGSTHHESVISSKDFETFLPKSIWHLEEPVSNPSALPFYWICKFAREYVKVVLTGQGADEPFAGYGRHLGEYYGKRYRGIPGMLRKKIITPLIDHLPRNEQMKRAVHSLDIENDLSRITKIYTIFDSELKKRLYLPDFYQETQKDLELIVNEWWQAASRLDSLNQMTYVDARFSLADNLLMYGDKMSMAVSLEARVPFLDLRLMEFVEGMPSRLKIHGRTQKYLLKKAVTKWLPPEIINRKKIGFATPVDQWFGRELKTYISDRLLGEGSACRKYFDATTIEKLIADHTMKHQDYKRHLFCLLTFELWHEQFISSTPPASPGN
jgi:asparagine synthase (glutamine-hydrolysing)